MGNPHPEDAVGRSLTVAELETLASDLLVVAPLRLEALAIKAGARKLRVRKTGMGPARSRRAVPGLREDPAAALVVMGVCGGLDQLCEPGDVVVADELLDGERDEYTAMSASDPLARNTSPFSRACARARAAGGNRTRRGGPLGWRA